ncbi:hypothetical protein T07_11941 [Trichinella nelsoni]|uniref:Uncharacterized protein n=1 Tax=Trichinella nelsoni TaxID=6336 RepID=A0A0V0S2X6_9BILA|nr:hypothetical protein T07_11941 [Trichinella nelsoni]
MLPFLLPIQIIDVPHRHSLHHSETMYGCQKIHIDEGLALMSPQSILASGVLTSLVPQSDFSEYSRPTIQIIDVPHRHSLHHSETMDCCQKIHIDEGLALMSPQSILASGVLTNLVPQSDFSEYSRPRSFFRKFPMDMLKYEFAKFQFDKISELDVAVNTSDLPTIDDIVNDIHCAKQENSDDSDTNTTTVETIPLKTYLKLNECVDHLERFIEATESADEGIYKDISVVRQFVEDHRPKLKLTTLKDFFSIINSSKKFSALVPPGRAQDEYERSQLPPDDTIVRYRPGAGNSWRSDTPHVRVLGQASIVMDFPSQQAGRPLPCCCRLGHHSPS